MILLLLLQQLLFLLLFLKLFDVLRNHLVDVRLHLGELLFRLSESSKLLVLHLVAERLFGLLKASSELRCSLRLSAENRLRWAGVDTKKLFGSQSSSRSSHVVKDLHSLVLVNADQVLGDLMNSLFRSLFISLQPEISFRRPFKSEIGTSLRSNRLEDIRQLKPNRACLAVAPGRGVQLEIMDKLVGL